MTERALPWVAVTSAVAGFGLCLFGWLEGGGTLEVPWAPSLDLTIHLAYDGLGALYALLATGIGALVFTYSAAYLPMHLRHERRSPRAGLVFWPWMVLFMAAMVGLACARDLVLLFVFFDLTAIASYFLIGFDRGHREARGAALMAMLVTGVSAVLLLVGAVLLYTTYRSFALPVLFQRVSESREPGTTTTVAVALIAVAALAKSAQVPLHFWLPYAMAAPTPVSAYLHSAAMVAAGVLVLGRVHPLLAGSAVVQDALLVIGLLSIAVGSLLALGMDELKQILAHSTISQYGYVVVLYGLGGSTTGGTKAAGAAALYVLAHALAKSALFMTAGAVTMATGESRLSCLGGLARRMPVLAVASAVAAGSVAALPLTVGYFKDELFFGAALKAGGVVPVLAVVAAALTFAYIGRFWFGLFTGTPGARPGSIPALLILPVVILAGVGLAGGFWVEPFARLAAAAGTVTAGAHVELAPAYHLDTRPENLMALAAWGLGIVLLLARRVRVPVTRAMARAGDLVGPRRLYGRLLLTLNQVSDRMHELELRDLRNSLAAVLVPGGVLVVIAVVVTPTARPYDVGTVARSDLPIIGLLVLVVLAAVTVARDKGRLRPVLALSVLGFALATVYAVMGAPDVALVAVVVETVLAVVFVGVFSRLPFTRVPTRKPSRRWRNLVAGTLAGLSAFATIWAALSRPTPAQGEGAALVRRAPEAHGSDVVTVILADFRGLDTLVEVTVLVVAVIGVASLLRQATDEGLW